MRLRSASAGVGRAELQERCAVGAFCAGSELPADARAGLGQVATLVHRAALLPAMGCSSSALNRASDSSGLRRGEQGTRPLPRPGLGIRVGLLPGGPKGATRVSPARQGAGCSLRTGVGPARLATHFGKPLDPRCGGPRAPRRARCPAKGRARGRPTGRATGEVAFNPYRGWRRVPLNR